MNALSGKIPAPVKKLGQVPSGSWFTMKTLFKIWLLKQLLTFKSHFA